MNKECHQERARGDQNLLLDILLQGVDFLLNTRRLFRRTQASHIEVLGIGLESSYPGLQLTVLLRLFGEFCRHLMQAGRLFGQLGTRLPVLRFKILVQKKENKLIS